MELAAPEMARFHLWAVIHRFAQETLLLLYFFCFFSSCNPPPPISARQEVCQQASLFTMPGEIVRAGKIFPQIFFIFLI